MVVRNYLTNNVIGDFYYDDIDIKGVAIVNGIKDNQIFKVQVEVDDVENQEEAIYVQNVV